ncbi:hypothetical protein ACFL2R_04030 [Patescibacteria group bacterium]
MEGLAWFALGTMSWWFLILFEIVGGFVWYVHRRNVGGLCVVIMGLGLMQFVGGMPIIQALVAHPWMIGVVFIGYLIAGLFYAAYELDQEVKFVQKRTGKLMKDFIAYIAKLGDSSSDTGNRGGFGHRDSSGTPYFMESATYNQLLRSMREHEDGDIRELWCAEMEKGTLPKVLKGAWRELRLHNDLRSLPVKASEYKEGIVTWMIWWPFGATWRVIDKFIINLWNTIFEWCKGFFQRVINRRFKSIDKSFMD